MTPMLDQAALERENAELRHQLDACRAELEEARQQQTATTEVLQVINASPGELQPVFDILLEKAMHLCGAAFGVLAVLEGEQTHTVADRGLPPALAEWRRNNPVISPQNTLLTRVVAGEPYVHTLDLKDDKLYRSGEPLRRANVDLGGARTSLYVPLLRDREVLGTIHIYRQEARPFTDKQIALLQNFAAQAVIAMENARLLTETREALEQQTATAEVLQVINSSPGDLAPVFDAILEKAHTLCGADHGHLTVYEGGQFRALATHGVPEAFINLLRQPFQPGLNVARRLLAGEVVIQFDDIAALSFDPDDRIGRGVVELAGARTLLIVALRKDDGLLGYITAHRIEVRPFTDKQIALLQNFAAQAVIAMENARLLIETREALEQQTATAEVLGVINSSPGDLAPVFEAMLEKATRLSETAFGAMFTYDGERFHITAAHGPPALVRSLEEFGPISAEPGTMLVRHLGGELVVQRADIASDQPTDAGPLVRRAFVDLGGARSSVSVALQKDHKLLGVIQAYRQEVRPFTEKQIALLENFAAQAVIAMENARLLTETREALAQQTATAEVLQVINSSPGDLAPVFDAMLERAMRLCGASYGSLTIYDGEHFRCVAGYGLPDALFELLRQPRHAPPDSAQERLLRGDPFVHVEDYGMRLPSSDQVAQAAVEIGKVRTILFVPLRKDGRLLGYLTANRREERPFTDKQIALLQNFAAQAVIAMENARLLTETREALEQQTATAEVLQVINSSPGDLAPVFAAMLEKATRLCEAPFGILRTWDGERFHFGAVHGAPQFSDWVRQRGPFRPASDDSLLGRIIAGERVVSFADALGDEGYRTDPGFRQMVKASGIRSAATVALHKDDALLGTITVYRQEVRPFTDKQIALLQNFAAQAVIAMENARLLTETREALEQQTATAEVLQVINSSPGDLAPVFDAMLEKATSLCEAAFGMLWTYEDEWFRAVASHHVPQRYAEFLWANPFRPAGASPNPGAPNALDRLARGEDLVRIDDVSTAPAYLSGDPRSRALVEMGHARSYLAVSLRKDGRLLGGIAVYRQEMRPFTDKQIALLQNFAAQAVIAMENARLLTETREALEQQTATAEVLQVINSSPGDLAPVFAAILEKAQSLCGVFRGSLELYDDENFRAVATRGLDHGFAEELRKGYRAADNPATRPLIEGQPFTHILDRSQHDFPFTRRAEDVGPAGTLLCVSLRRDDRLLGMIAAARREVQPFTEKQIALLQNFAAQAVIAMENARLIDEIRQRQAELRVTFDNMGDGVVMFDEELRLAAWNRNFQELLDLPDEVLLPRPSYAEYLRILADRGEFGSGDVEGELSRRLVEADQELRLERTRPDGRVIEVRRNAVPGGGFVLIYSDITARKRAEAEIRAARDAAEQALGELKTAQASLIHAEKMASLGQLTAGIAHEIKNPLNFVNNFAGLSVELLDELKAAAAPAIDALDDGIRGQIDETLAMLTGNLDKIAEHGRRADGIVTSMLAHSRGTSGERQAVDINAVVEEALNLAYHGARAQDQDFNVTLERDFGRNVAPIELVPQDITRVLLNLVGNGFYATRKRRDGVNRAEFEPRLKVTTRDLGADVEIRVRDNGAGIPPEVKDKLFQPFFTTKPAGEGTGLGLSISYDIVTQQHGGTIEVDSRPGEYTEFTIRLPRRAAARAG